MTLLVISHTEHYLAEDGKIVGWASTVKELDELASSFSRVIHIACLHRVKAPVGLASYSQPNIEFVPIPPSGGSGLRKLSSIYVMPTIIWKVFRFLRHATVFQFRAPTAMGVYIIPLLTIFSRKKGWFKYAGNWGHPNPPLSYAIQRFWLAQWQRRKVTINGVWPDQPGHCLSFENPCLTDQDIAAGSRAIKEKSFTDPYNFVFVGRLDKNKGVDIMIQALGLIGKHDKLGNIHIIGDGPEKSNLILLSHRANLTTSFHGFLDRNSVFRILAQSHVLVLPSASEGFPKVLAEAWNFGCVPVVSRVSAIDQYVVNGVNGFLIAPEQRNPEDVRKMLTDILEGFNISEIAIKGSRLAPKFKYKTYISRLFNEVIGNDQAAH